MSLVIPPGYGLAQFVFTGAVGTQPYVTTLGVDLSEAGGDFVAAANKAKASYAIGLLPITSNQLTLDRVTLSVGSDGPGGSVDSDTPPVPGTSSGAMPPTAMSAIARKVTNILGRPGRGRMFLPGAVAENQVDQDGSVTPAARTSINNALATFYEDLVDGEGAAAPSLPPVLLHSNGALPPTPITGLIVSDLVGWIRGRIR